MDLLSAIIPHFLLLAQATPAAGAQSQPGAGSLFFPLILTVGIMYFLLFRPQQNRIKEQKKFLETLKKGDHVVTNGGMYGRIWAVEEKVITLEVSRDVRIQVTRDSVAARARPDGQEIAKEGSAESKA